MKYLIIVTLFLVGCRETVVQHIKKWDFMPYSMNMNAKEYITYYSEYTKKNFNRRFDTYEEALEIGLQEGLKLIEK
jgi:hypothetical protein